MIVCPGVEAGAAELFGIRHGRLFEQITFLDVHDEAVPGLVATFLDRVRAAASAPPVVSQEEVDAIIIIGRWLARFADSPRVVHLDDEAADQVVERVVAAMRSRCLLLEPEDAGWEDEASDG